MFTRQLTNLAIDLPGEPPGEACTTTLRAEGVGLNVTPLEFPNYLAPQIPDFGLPKQTTVTMPTSSFGLRRLDITDDQNCAPPMAVEIVEFCTQGTLSMSPVELRPSGVGSLDFDLIISSDTVPDGGSCRVDWKVQSAGGRFVPLGPPVLGASWEGTVYLNANNSPKVVTRKVAIKDDFASRGGVGRLLGSADLFDMTGQQLSPGTISGKQIDVTLAACTCSVTGENLHAVAGGALELYEFTVENLSNDECDFRWDVDQTGLIGPVSIPGLPQGGDVTVLAGQQLPISVPFAVTTPTNASNDAKLRLEVKNGAGNTCEWNPSRPNRVLVRHNYVCVLPQNEVAEFLPLAGQDGWDCKKDGDRPNQCESGSPGRTVAAFAGNVLPMDASFGGRRTREHSPSPYSVDTCWDRYRTYRQNHANPASIPRQLCNRMTLAGQANAPDWRVGSQNQWKTDGIGLPSACIDRYRQVGLAPCQMAVDQDMQMLCRHLTGVDEWQTYEDLGLLEINIGSTTVTAIRNVSGGSDADTTNY